MLLIETSYPDRDRFFAVAVDGRRCHAAPRWEGDRRAAAGDGSAEERLRCVLGEVDRHELRLDVDRRFAGNESRQKE